MAEEKQTEKKKKQKARMEMVDSRPVIRIDEIRRQLWLCERILGSFQGRNKLEEKYRGKIRYMLMHLRLYPCEKKIIDNWHMPDYYDILALGKPKEDKRRDR